MELSVLFDGAADFRVLGGGNQPSAILSSQHKYEHAGESSGITP
jgi:hypothetical protein